MVTQQEDIGKSSSVSAGSTDSKSNTQKDKKNKKNTGNTTTKVTTYKTSGTLITLTSGQDNPVNELTSDLVGGTITITNPHTLVESDIYTTAAGYTLPTTYSSTISKVKNSNEFEVLEPYKVTDKNNKTFPVSLTSGNTTISYDTYKTFTEDTVYQRSYANIIVGNLRTFSGDVYKAKVYTRDSGTSTDYEQVYENYVIPENELVDESSITGYDNIGFFHTESIIHNNWNSSSTAGDTGNFVTLTNEKLIDSVSISGSVSGINDKVVFRTKNANTLQKGVDYVVRFNAYYYKSISERKTLNNKIENKNYASLKVYLSGSAITGANGEDDVFVGEVDVTDSMGSEGEILGVVGQFRTAGTGTTKTWLKFELNSGEFHIQDVSIEPFSETNFNPNFFKALVPMPKPVKRGDSYDFLVEFYDCNNNISTTTAEVKGVTFQGPRQVVADGLDGVFEGAMVLGQSVEMYGSNPAYIRSVGYNGFDKTKAGTGDRNGGFLIWSGSIGNGATLNRLTSSEAYEGVGIEILDASGSDTYNHSFLQFASNYKNTGNSRFRVQTKEFLLGLSGSGQAGDTYISGSEGNLEISSSNFLLARDGSVTMQGTITATAGGTIGGFTIGSDNLTATNFVLNTTDKSLSLGSGNNIFIADADTGIQLGHATFGSAPFRVTPAGVLTATSATIQGAITATSGEIGGFAIDEDEIKSGTTFILDSDTSSGQIKLGASGGPGSATGTSNAGAYIDGTGKFNFVGDSNNFIRFNSSGLEINTAKFDVNTSGEITATGGTIGGWTLSNTTLANGTNIVLDSTNKTISLNDSTFANQGIQLDYNSGSPRFYAGDGSNKFIKFDGTNVEIESEKFELDASNLEISSTQASMSLGEGKIRLKGGSTSFMTIGTGGNAISASVDSSDKFISIGKSDFSEFDQSTKGFIVGDNGGIFRFEVALDAQNYMSFDGNTDRLDIKTKKFLLDTDNLDIDSDNKKITITDAQGTPRERVRIGKVDAGADNYGLKIFDGTGAAADGTILAEFSNDQNVIAGWNISTSTISSNNLILNSAGQISSQGYASNTQGFFLGAVEMADGSVGSFLEVDEARIRGTLKTTVFEKESVNAVGGQLHIANATTITGSATMSVDDDTMQVANASGFEAGEIILLKKFNSTGFTTEYMKVHSAAREDGGSATNFSGSLVVTRSLGTSPTGGTESGSIGGTGASAQEYTPGQVVVSTGKVGTGYIRLNANPNDQTTPYMDIVERTGTGVYDIDLKARLGDLSGIVDTINGQSVSGFGLYTDNAFLKGGIVANYGSIGGLNVSSTDLWAGNSSLGAGGTVMVIGDITSSPKIALGGTANSMNLNTGDGIFMSSSGEFRVGDVDGDRLIFESGNFAVTSSNFGLDAGTLHISSSNNGAIALGTGGPGSQAPTELDDNGILLLGSGYFNLQNSATNYIRNNASGFDIASTNFTLKGDTTLFMDSATNSGKITLGTNASSIVHTGTGIYLDGTGKFSFVEDGSNYIQGGNNNFEIASEDFTLKGGTTMLMDSATNSGVIKLGATATNITETANTGVYIDGTGKFRIGTATSGDNYIHFDGSTGLDIKTDTFTLSSGKLSINSSTERIQLGDVSDFLKSHSDKGILLGKDGSEYELFIGQEDGGRIHWNGSTLEVNGSISFTNSPNISTFTNDTGFTDDTVANSKPSIFRQTSIPSTSSPVGSLWYDTDDDNKLYVLVSGTPNVWTPTQDGDIVTAQSAADAAQTDATTANNAATAVSDDLQDVIDGVSVSGTGTFIDANVIYSPLIAGTNGYISNVFKVGNNGITLDGPNRKIYIGTGTYNNSNTPFYFASGSTNVFSLGDKLSFDGADLTVSGDITATNLTATTAGNIGGWSIDSSKLNKLSGSSSDVNAGIILDSTNNRIIVSGSGVSTTDNSVKLLGDEGVLEVSQSGAGVFDTGRLKTFTTTYFVKTDSIKPSSGFVKGPDSNTELPHTITRITDSQAAPKVLNIDVDNSVDAGIVKTDKLFVTTPTGQGGTNVYMNAERDINTLTFNGATNPTASYYFGNNIDYSFSETSNANLHPGFHYHYHVSNSTFAGAEQPIGFVQGGVASGSSIFTISTAMISTENNDFGDAQFNLLALDTNLSGIDPTLQNEYTFFQARHSGSIRAQLQHDGDFVSKGNITAFGTSFLTVSDEREKKNIYTISESLDRILELRPTKFTWRETDKEDVGFIAQEVEEVIPEVIETSRGFINTGDDKERKTIAYPKLVPYLVDTIQVLTKRIEELEKKVK